MQVELDRGRFGRRKKRMECDNKGRWSDGQDGFVSSKSDEPTCCSSQPIPRLLNMIISDDPRQ